MQTVPQLTPCFLLQRTFSLFWKWQHSGRYNFLELTLDLHHFTTTTVIKNAFYLNNTLSSRLTSSVFWCDIETDPKKTAELFQRSDGEWTGLPDAILYGSEKFDVQQHNVFGQLYLVSILWSFNGAQLCSKRVQHKKIKGLTWVPSGHAGIELRTTAPIRMYTNRRWVSFQIHQRIAYQANCQTNLFKGRPNWKQYDTLRSKQMRQSWQSILEIKLTRSNCKGERADLLDVQCNVIFVISHRHTKDITESSA